MDKGTLPTVSSMLASISTMSCGGWPSMVDGASRLGHRGTSGTTGRGQEGAVWISWIRALVTVEELLDSSTELAVMCWSLPHRTLD